MRACFLFTNLNSYAIAIIFPYMLTKIVCLHTILDIAVSFVKVLVVALAIAIVAIALTDLLIKAALAALIFCCHLAVAVLPMLVSGFCILYMCSGCAVWH